MSGDLFILRIETAVLSWSNRLSRISTFWSLQRLPAWIPRELEAEMQRIFPSPELWERSKKPTSNHGQFPLWNHGTSNGNLKFAWNSRHRAGIRVGLQGRIGQVQVNRFSLGCLVAWRASPESDVGYWISMKLLYPIMIYYVSNKWYIIIV